MEAFLNKIEEVFANKRLFAIVLVVTAVLAAFLLLLYGYNRCNKGCTAHYSKGIDIVASSTVLTVDKDARSGYLGYSIYGEVKSIGEENGLMRIVLADYLNDTVINGSTVEYPIYLDDSSLDSASSQKLRKLIENVEEDFNRIYKLELDYQRRSDLEAKIKAFFILSFNGLTDMDYDLSKIPTDISFDWDFYSPDELTDNCAKEFTDTPVTDLAFKAFDSIIEQYSKSELPETELDAVPENQERIKPKTVEEIMSSSSKVICDTCDNTCMLVDYKQVGLDPLYFPMTLNVLRNHPENINDLSRYVSISDVILSGYFSGSSVDMDTITDFEDWQPIKKSDGSAWAIEPICMNYLNAKVLDPMEYSEIINGDKAICFLFGESNSDSIENFIKENNYDQSDFTDDVFVKNAISILNGDLDITEDLDKEATSSWFKLAVDNYVYGYESDNEKIINAGNERTLQTIAGLRSDFERYGGELNNYPARLNIKRVVRSLIVKMRYVNDDKRAEIYKIIDLIKDIWGEDVFREIYINEGGWIYPNTYVETEGFPSIDHLLEIYLQDKDFYDSEIGIDIDKAIGGLFLEHYVSDSCGKSDFRLFGYNSSDGTCASLNISSSQNLRIIHDLLIYDLLNEDKQ